MLVREWDDGTRIIRPIVEFADLCEYDKETVVRTFEKLTRSVDKIAIAANSMHMLRVDKKFQRAHNHKMNIMWYICGSNLHAHTGLNK